jgi:hypothetical protein
MKKAPKAKELRIARKKYERETKKIIEISNLPKDKIETRSEKWKKHVPTSNENEIEYLFLDENENAIVIKFKDHDNNISKQKYYGNENTWKNGDHSFSLSTIGLKEHFEYIINQLQCIHNVISFILKGKITNSIDIKSASKYECILDVTKEFNSDYRTSFKKVFFVNIFPQHAFVFNKDTKTVKIATYYILGINEDKIHVMFGYGNKFNIMHCGSRGIDQQINKYNNDNDYKVTDIPKICENLAPILSTGYAAIGNCIYKTSLDNINDERKTEVIKYVDSEEDLLRELSRLNNFEKNIY